MDTMALLCTLHGDGPATLKTLRRSGLTTLDAIAQEDAERLSALLGIPAAAVRRLQKEASLLDERCGPAVDEEEAPPIAARTVPHSGPQDVVHPAAWAAAVDPDELDARDRALVRRVMAQARADAPGTASPEPEALSPAPEAAGPGPVTTMAMAPGTELVPGRLDSLDGDLCRRLYQAGVHTIQDLCQADPLDLGRAIGLGFSRTCRLQFLARRSASVKAPMSDEGEPEGQVVPMPGPPASGTASEPVERQVRLPRFSAADRPQDPTPPALDLEEIASEGAGGPFAQ